MDLKKITDIIGFSKVNPEDSLPIVKKIETEESKIVPTERIELLNWSIDIDSIYIPKRYKSTIVILGSLFIIYLILNQDYVFVITLLSMLFLFNVLNSMKQNTVTYKIYNTGIDYFGTFYKWEKIQFYFFFTDKDIIGLDTFDVTPGRLYVYFKPEDRDKLDNLLSTKLDKALIVPKNYIDMLVDKIKPYVDFTDK